eukprot:scaffold99595_cov18-Tisochrysis_lutea.AAC.2
MAATVARPQSRRAAALLHANGRHAPHQQHVPAASAPPPTRHPGPAEKACMALINSESQQGKHPCMLQESTHASRDCRESMHRANKVKRSKGRGFGGLDTLCSGCAQLTAEVHTLISRCKVRSGRHDAWNECGNPLRDGEHKSKVRTTDLENSEYHHRLFKAQRAKEQGA